MKNDEKLALFLRAAADGTEKDFKEICRSLNISPGDTDELIFRATGLHGEDYLERMVKKDF